MAIVNPGMAPAKIPASVPTNINPSVTGSKTLLAKACKIIDDAIQIHGATGVSQWSPLPGMYVKQRILRLADGPDEVHHHVVARAEVNSYELSNVRKVASNE